MPAPIQRDLLVLLIEPDAALRRVMAVGLRQRGLRIVEARSLGEAWERVGGDEGRGGGVRTADCGGPFGRGGGGVVDGGGEEDEPEGVEGADAEGEEEVRDQSEDEVWNNLNQDFEIIVLDEKDYFTRI